MSWVRVASSPEVGVGEVVGVDHDPLELVVWRATDGQVCVMDARCPHQWSYLGGEGVVDGDEIVCAAHFWRFDRTGHGSKVNVLGRRDVKADIAVFPAVERDGEIHADLPE